MSIKAMVRDAWLDTWLAVLVGLAFLLAAAFYAASPAAAQSGAQSGLDPDLVEQLQGGAVPGNTLGVNPRSDAWRDVRQGIQGTVSIPDEKAGILVQSSGENWRNIRNGPLSTWGAWALLGSVALLALFFLLRGRIRIEHGRSGQTITRFTSIERMGHWILAVSFIILALTGLNIMYGRYVILPVIGPEAFGMITLWGKYLHNYVAFAFMLGLAMIFVMWVAHNIPNRLDLAWIAKGGGLFSKGVHPPSRKFNAGQKMIFWLVILGGVSLALSGWSLMFPFEYPMFAKTFAVINVIGLNLPTDLTSIEEMQFAQVWHTMVGVFLIAVVIAHIYIGSIGMEGAFDAMGTGEVDLNWAREHHNLWVEEMEAKHPASGPGSVHPAPAE